jgi:hypothetical protein
LRLTNWQRTIDSIEHLAIGKAERHFLTIAGVEAHIRGVQMTLRGAFNGA